ncbi:MAG: reverse transcriptase family protein [Myxococcota bacterium]
MAAFATICDVLTLTLLAEDEWQSRIEARLNDAVAGLPQTWLKRRARAWRKEQTRPTVEALRDAFARSDDLRAATLRIRRWPLESPTMKGRLGAIELPTVGDAAKALRVFPEELLWLADGAGRQAHYRRRWIPKRRGGRRLVEAPRPRLCAIQRRLASLLQVVPPHPASHGFVRGSDVHAHARLHAKKRWVLKLDLADFFPHVGRGRVRATFRSLGYPDDVARTLASLCTTQTPLSLLRDADAAERALFGRRHLPQGAPTSPHLANLAAWGLDVRLSAFARAASLVYSRYADDLVLSGAHVHPDAIARIAAIAIEEGFPLQLRKTRRMGSGVRQQVCGLVVNQTPGVSRADYDRLRAILHRCARYGFAAENRDAHPNFAAHLRGRIEWVGRGRPARRAKLLRLWAEASAATELAVEEPNAP